MKFQAESKSMKSLNRKEMTVDDVAFTLIEDKVWKIPQLRVAMVAQSSHSIGVFNAIKSIFSSFYYSFQSNCFVRSFASLIFLNFSFFP